MSSSEEALVTIDGVSADQLVGNETAHLATGVLALHPLAVDDKHHITLTLAHIAFALDPTLTTFFTHAQNPRWYFFFVAPSNH